MTRTIIQLYRGTTAQNDAFTGSAGELSFDTTTNQVRVHDGTTVGGHIIGSGGGYHPNLFDWKWADHELNDVQWLRADTFSWQSGAVYQAAFNDLFNDIYISTSWRATGYANVYTASPTPEVGDTVYSDSACTTSVGTVTSYDSGNNQMSYNSVTWDYNSNSYVTPASETVAGYTGHSGKKIVSWQDESNVASIYSATGVAWYYIIDIANKRFKLPRTQFGVTGLRDTVGKYVEAGLPNISGEAQVERQRDNDYVTGAFTVTGTTVVHTDRASAGGSAASLGFDASLSNSIYGNASTVQPPATQMYLYFYVGNFTQTALENTAGLNASLFNGKADTDFGNTSMIDYVIEKQDPTALNGYTWYRKYKSGWVEQGGYDVVSSNNDSITKNLPITMADNNYIVELTKSTDAGWSANTYAPHTRVLTTTYFTYSVNIDYSNSRLMWVVYGKAA